MNPFQKSYDWFKHLATPPYLTELLEVLLSVTKNALKTLGKEATDFLIEAIITQAKRDISGSDKFVNVYNAFRDEYSDSNISERLLNLLIELLVNTLKKDNVI